MTDANARVFVDTNVLIRLHVATAADHPLAEQAARRLILNGSELWISRQVMREYASVLTRPQPYVESLAAAEVAQQLRLFEASYQIADETSEVTTRLCILLETVPVGGKQVHDANIVATMQTYAIDQLLTLNTADFTRFGSLITVLTPKAVLNDGAE